MSEHEHRWGLPAGGYVVIDTFPPQYPYECACGRHTHNPQTGVPCRICWPHEVPATASPKE